MKRYQLTRTLTKEDVRQVCISHQYYTRGDCKAYEEMFSILDYVTKHSGSNISAIRLEEIAEDIKAHSDTEDTVLEIMETLAFHIKTTVRVIEE